MKAESPFKNQKYIKVQNKLRPSKKKSAKNDRVKDGEIPYDPESATKHTNPTISNRESILIIQAIHLIYGNHLHLTKVMMIVHMKIRINIGNGKKLSGCGIHFVLS